MNDDRSRLFTGVVDALIDRAPIDWHALKARVRAPRDVGLIESLRALEVIRSSSASPPILRTPSSVAAALIASVAVLQLVLGSVAIAHAAMAATTIGERFPQVMLAAAFAAAALLLGSRRTRDRRRLFLLTAFLIVASTFIRGTILSVDGDINGSIHGWLDPLTRGVTLEAFLPACVWRFALDFPRVHRFTSFDIWTRRIVTIMWLFGWTTLAFNLAGSYELIPEWTNRIVALDARDSMFWHVSTITIAPAAVALFLRSRRAPHHERVKVSRLAKALVAGGLPFLALGLVRTVVPAFNRWLSHAAASDRFWIDLIVIGGLMASPILSTVAVIVDRPFEIRATWWRWSRARTLSARRLATAIERMTTACGPRETTFVLERELRSGIGATRTRMMVPTRDGSFVDHARDLTPLATGTALHALIDVETTIDLARSGPAFELLPTTDREWVIANDVELMAPLRRRNGDIAALLAIGPQRGGHAYAPDDHTFVTALAAAAGLAWNADRARPHARLAQPAYECEGCGVLHDSRVHPCTTCGGTLTLAALPRGLNAKFIVERRIGKGGAGVVYLARDVTIGREVVLKTLPTLRRGVRTRLADEARTMASLRHDGLAMIYGLEIWRQIPILVVEYFPEGTLARRLAAGPLSPSEAIHFGIALADTLCYLHGRGLLHRDIKPSNIALSPTGSPVLLDFGLATWLEPRPTALEPDARIEDRTLAGTPAYLPPEAFQRAPVSPAFDLWAFMVVLLECVSGTKPLHALERSDTRGQVMIRDLSDRLSNLRPSAPALTAILERGLDRDVARRFQTGADVRTALQSASQGLSL